MINIDKKTTAIKFTFESGEHQGESYVGLLIACSSPLCHCKEVSVEFRNEHNDDEKSSNNAKLYSFAIDLGLRKVVERENNETADLNIAQAFVNDLADDDWHGMFRYFLEMKTYHTENAKLSELNIVFPDDVVNENVMVGYLEILYYGEQLTTLKVGGGDTYWVADQYCVHPDCSCTDAVLSFSPLIKNGVHIKELEVAIVIKYDYKKDR